METLTAAKLASKRTPATELDEQGNTPLHLAAMAGDGESIFHLLAQGANPDAKNLAGHNPGEAAEQALGKRPAELALFFAPAA